MPTFLTSSSTLADVRAAYDNNAAYRANGSTDQAWQFANACRVLMNRLQSEARSDSHSIREELGRFRDEITEAENFAKENAGRGSRICRLRTGY